MLALWVIGVFAVMLLIMVTLAWFTWRLFGSFRMEQLTEDRVEADSLDVLLEAQAELESGVDKLTQELDLMKARRARW